MSFFSDVYAVAKREVKETLSLPWLVVMFVAMPLVWCVLLVGVFNGGFLRELPVGLVDLDHTPESYEFAQKIDAMPSARLVSMTSPQEARSALKRGELYAYLTIPHGWTANLNQPDSLAIEGYFPKSIYAVAVSLELDIKTALGQFSLDSAKRLAIAAGANHKQADRALNAMSVQAVTLGNLAFNFQAYLLPVIIPGILHLGLALVIVTRLSAEWQEKSVKEWLKVANGHMDAALLGKLLPWWGYYSILGALYVAYFAGYCGWFAQGSIIFWVFGLALLLAVIALLPVFVMGLAMKAGWIIATSFCVGYIAPIFPFTGFSFPFDAMQPWVKVLSQIFPLTHYVQFQGEQWILGAPLSASLITLGKLALFGLFWGLLGWPAMKKQIRTRIAEEAQS